MNSEITDCFENGLVKPLFQAEKNKLIWKYIADEIDFLKNQKKETQQEYCYLQSSVQQIVVLSLCHILDKENNKHPTRCLYRFLKIIKEQKTDNEPIIETFNTKKIMVYYSCPQELIDSVNFPDKSLFMRLFSDYYIDKISNIDVRSDIKSLFFIRDKIIAHNEVTPDQKLDWIVPVRLINLITEIVAVFGMANYSCSYVSGNKNAIKESAIKDVSFIKININHLKQL
jgi:hypothetical protein